MRGVRVNLGEEIRQMDEACEGSCGDGRLGEVGLGDGGCDAKGVGGEEEEGLWMRVRSGGVKRMSEEKE